MCKPLGEALTLKKCHCCTKWVSRLCRTQWHTHTAAPGDACRQWAPQKLPQQHTLQTAMGWAAAWIRDAAQTSPSERGQLTQSPFPAFSYGSGDSEDEEHEFGLLLNLTDLWSWKLSTTTDSKSPVLLHNGAFALKGGRELASWNIHNLWLNSWQLQLISNPYLSKVAESNIG